MQANTLTPYDELCAYTLSLRDAGFLHQLVVDAHCIQNATADTRPFALITLYLHAEKGFTGRQAQRYHMQMARTRKNWPRLPLPTGNTGIAAADIMAAPSGEPRNAAIRAWAVAVWKSCPDAHSAVRALDAAELSIHL
jgi:hypothetical protein